MTNTIDHEPAHVATPATITTGAAAMASENDQQDQSATPATVEAPSAESAAKAPSAPTPDDAPEMGEAGKRAIRQEREAARQATEAKKTAEDRLAAVLKAAGIGDDGEQDDPAEQLQATQQRAEQHQAENAVLRAASAAGADADALLDSRRFTDSLTGLDITDRDTVVDHVREWVKDHPRYSTRTGGVRDAAAGRSGGTSAAESEPGAPRMAAAFEHKLKTRKR